MFIRMYIFYMIIIIIITITVMYKYNDHVWIRDGFIQMGLIYDTVEHTAAVSVRAKTKQNSGWDRKNYWWMWMWVSMERTATTKSERMRMMLPIIIQSVAAGCARPGVKGDSSHAITPTTLKVFDVFGNRPCSLGLSRILKLVSPLPVNS